MVVISVPKTDLAHDLTFHMHSLKSLKYLCESMQTNGPAQEQKLNLHGRGNNTLHVLYPRTSQTAIFWVLHVKHHKDKTFLMTTYPPGKDTSCTALKIHPCSSLCLCKMLQLRRSAWCAFVVLKPRKRNTNPQSGITIFSVTSGKCEENFRVLMFDWRVIGLFRSAVNLTSQ